MPWPFSAEWPAIDFQCSLPVDRPIVAIHKCSARFLSKMMTIVVGIRCNIVAVIRVKYYFAADILAPLQRTRSKEAGQIQIIVHVKTYV